MGKVDDMRAIREARFAKTQATAPPAKRAAVAKKALAQATGGPTPVATACGHRSVGGKFCIREKGHEAEGTKSHRYAKS